MDIKSIGRALRKARLERRETLHDVHVATGVGIASISNLETGVTEDLRYSTLKTLIDYVRLEIRLVSIEDFTLDDALAEQRAANRTYGPMG